VNASRVVLVTGAARRVGRAIALDLAAQGWVVAVHYRHSAADADAVCRQIVAQGGSALPFAADLADEPACAGLIPAVIQALGRLDAVVSSAATFEHDSVDTFSHAAMSRHWQANTAPTLILARSLHEHLVSRDGRGCLVALLDQKLWNPNPDHLSYTLSKAALQAALPLLARALAPRLRVNAVAPGLVLGSDQIDDQALAAFKAGAPLGLGASAADIAAAVRYLLDAAAVTDATLIVDGGQHMQAQPRDFGFLPAPAPD
jgi:NAD(P)-dependent dehydrogenase (short-subunit alcohol dehydrogenase family)